MGGSHAIEPPEEYGDGPRVMAQTVTGTFEQAQFGAAMSVYQLAGV